MQQGRPLSKESRYEAAGDHVYHSIKACVIAYKFRQGQRIYLEPIAADLKVSTTPVREALNRLAAEDLVIKAPRKGFIAMRLCEENLLQHYDLTRLLLVHELEDVSSSPEARSKLAEFEPIANVLYKLNRSTITNVDTLAIYSGEIFSHIASLGENAYVTRAVGRANDHLHYIRSVECHHFQDVHRELVLMCELLLGGHCEDLLDALNDYFSRRIELLPELLDLIGRRTGSRGK